jgi:hypothetical protein
VPEIREIMVSYFHAADADATNTDLAAVKKRAEL